MSKKRYAFNVAIAEPGRVTAYYAQKSVHISENHIRGEQFPGRESLAFRETLDRSIDNATVITINRVVDGSGEKRD